MAFNWEDEDNGDTFRDVPDEVYGENAPPSNVVGAAQMSPRQVPSGQQRAELVDTPEQTFLDEVLHEEESEEESESFEADANLRIELATLYKMIMNHDLFADTDADPRAVEVVTRGIRKFAREQVEIMLGMRSVAPKTAIVSSPFNDIEVMVLKKLASTYSKGATETAEANKPQPAAKAIARREGLNAIGTTKPVTKPVAPAKKALVQKPQAPVQRKVAVDQMVDTYKPPTKEPGQVTHEEFLQRNKEATARQAGRQPAKSTTALPMPSADQEAMFQEHRVLQSDHPLASPNAVSAIVAALNKSKSQ